MPFCQTEGAEEDVGANEGADDGVIEGANVKVGAIDGTDDVVGTTEDVGEDDGERASG